MDNWIQVAIIAGLVIVALCVVIYAIKRSNRPATYAEAKKILGEDHILVPEDSYKEIEIHYPAKVLREVKKTGTRWYLVWLKGDSLEQLAAEQKREQEKSFFCPTWQLAFNHNPDWAENFSYDGWYLINLCSPGQLDTIKGYIPSQPEDSIICEFLILATKQKIKLAGMAGAWSEGVDKYCWESSPGKFIHYEFNKQQFFFSTMRLDVLIYPKHF